jgi:hypothetical protein
MTDYFQTNEDDPAPGTQIRHRKEKERILREENKRERAAQKKPSKRQIDPAWLAKRERINEIIDRLEEIHYQIEAPMEDRDRIRLRTEKRSLSAELNQLKEQTTGVVYLPAEPGQEEQDNDGRVADGPITVHDIGAAFGRALQRIAKERGQ